jgi:hypothetical protein
MEVKTDPEIGVTYIRMIPRGGEKGKIAYNVVLKPEALVADFNADDELVGVEVIDRALMKTGVANLVAMARAEAPHMVRRKQPEQAPAGGRERHERSDRRRG